MKVKMEFTGGLELSKALEELGAESTVAGRRALRTTANELRDTLKVTAPRGDGPLKEKYGRLNQNIRVREERAKKDRTVVMRVHTGRAFWGLFRELGTSRQPARPWFRPVFDRMAESLIGTLGKQLGKQIELAAARIARRGRVG